MENNIIERLKSFIDYTGLNNSQFSDNCNIPRPSLSQILSGRNKKISNQLLELIHDAFPKLNIGWLLFGEGSMLKFENENPMAESENFDMSDPEPSEARSEPYPIYGKQNSENAFFPTNESGADLQRNLEGLTTPANTYKSTEKQYNDPYLQIHELQMQIDKLHQQLGEINKNPRKVASITVYYDDSTFEIFKPAEKTLFQS